MGAHHMTQLVGLCAIALGCSARQKSLAPYGSHSAANSRATASEVIGTWRLVEFWDRGSVKGINLAVAKSGQTSQNRTFP